MATNTTNYSLIKPGVNDPADQDLWGGYLNQNFDTIDTQMKTNADNASTSTAAKTADYTVVAGDKNSTILIDASLGDIDVTMLDASTAGDGFTICFKRTDSTSNAVSIAVSDNVDGETTYSLLSQYDAVIMVCDGSEYHLKSVYATDTMTGVLHVQEVKATGTDGDTVAAAATYQKRSINTEQKNTITGASVDTGNNRFTLPAGDYKIFFSGALYGYGRSNRVRLRNITDGSTTILGLSSYNGYLSGGDSANALVGSDADGSGFFTLADSKTFEIQHIVESITGTGGVPAPLLGKAVSDGESEVYTNVIVEKIG